MFGRNKNIADLTLTDLTGRRVLVNAFDVVRVEERNEGAVLTLNAPVAGSKWETKDGVRQEVQESFDEIAQMRAKLG